MASTTLLYVSNEADPSSVTTLSIYSFPSGTLVGVLYGFNDPAGLCVDKVGDVYVTDAILQEIFEYPHAGVNPIKILADSLGTAISCAVDEITGNLAVGNEQNVLIYPKASGTPTEYTNSNFSQYGFMSYDTLGNLFVDGLTQSFQSVYAEVPKGGNSLGSITLNYSVPDAYGLQWAGKVLAICETGRLPFVVYRFSISGSAGTLVGSTTLDGASLTKQILTRSLGKNQPTLLVGADGTGNAVHFWNYPRGGNPTMTITNGIDNPFGVTVSKGTI